MTAYEKRFTANSEFEARTAGNQFTVTGYAAVFNFDTDLVNFRERVNPGSFKKTIQEADVRCLYNHDPFYVLGRNRAGTLRMAEDSRGLHYEVDLPDSPMGRNVYESIQRGDISQSSYQFRAIQQDWINEERSTVRVLREVALIDVAPVTFPANDNTTVGSSDIESFGQRALEQLAEQRNLDLTVVKNNLVAVVSGEYEPHKRTRIAPLLDDEEELRLRFR